VACQSSTKDRSVYSRAEEEEYEEENQKCIITQEEQVERIKKGESALRRMLFSAQLRCHYRFSAPSLIIVPSPQIFCLVEI